jgi:hypothetical protein
MEENEMSGTFRTRWEMRNTNTALIAKTDWNDHLHDSGISCQTWQSKNSSIL